MREMSISENYEGEITPIRSNISRFSRGTVLFNHARRYDLFDRNPIQWVRQSAKRRSVPDVLTCTEVRKLLAALEPRERIMVLLDVATGT